MYWHLRDNASALSCCLPGDVNTSFNLIKVCLHSSFHWNIEPFSHSLCNGLAMIAKFFSHISCNRSKDQESPLICLGVFWSGPVLNSFNFIRTCTNSFFWDHTLQKKNLSLVWILFLTRRRVQSPQVKHSKYFLLFCLSPTIW